MTTAIKKAEEEIGRRQDTLLLGRHCAQRMEVVLPAVSKGLVTINHEDLKQLHDVKVLLRAHGEPPETHALACRNNIEISMRHRPVVRLALQRRIKRQYENLPEQQEQQPGGLRGTFGHACTGPTKQERSRLSYSGKTSCGGKCWAGRTDQQPCYCDSSFDRCEAT